MAGGAIKGITISFRGETTQLDRALNNVKKEAKTTANELKQIDKAIKFNPTSVDAWKQKQIVLNKAITETREKLNLMRDGLRAMEAQGLNADNSEEFRRMQREIDQTERYLKSLQNELKAIGNVNLRAASEQFKEWGTALDNAGQKMRGVSMAAAAVATSIGALAVKSGQWADDLNTMSKRYSIATQDLQKYSVAANLVDVSTEAIAKSQTRLKKSMLSASQGSKTQVAAFEALGVSVTNADGSLRDGDEVFQDVITSLGQMTNETERDALAMQLMGRSANELNPLIEDGGETYKRVSETLKKYGLDFIDQETLDKANQFNDTLDTIKAIGLVTFQSIGAQLAGYLAPAFEKVVGAVGKFAQWLSKLKPQTLTVIASFAAVVAALAPLLIGLGKVSMGISALIKVVNLAGVAIGALSGPILPIVAILGVLAGAFIHLWKTNEDFRNKVTAIWKTVRDTIVSFVDEASAKVSQLISIFTGGSGSIKAAWDAFCNTLAPAFETAFNVVITVVQTVLNTILGVLDVFIGVFTGNWTQAWTGIKTIFEALWNALVMFFQLIWTQIVTIVTAQLNLVKTIMTSILNAVLAFIRNVWNAIQTAIATAIETAKTKVQNTVNSIKNLVTTAFNALKTTVANIWNGIKDAIIQPIESAKNMLSSIIEKIKSFFPIKLGKILSFKMPKISVGSQTVTVGDKEVKVPTFDITWESHAAGGIFDRPTLLTDRNGGLHQVGEAGAEAIIPLDRFWNTLENNNARTDSLLVAQNQILMAMLAQLQQEKDIKIDGRVAGRIINDLVRV